MEYNNEKDLHDNAPMSYKRKSSGCVLKRDETFKAYAKTVYGAKLKRMFSPVRGKVKPGRGKETIKNEKFSAVELL